jgi:hypothetical protein
MINEEIVRESDELCKRLKKLGVFENVRKVTPVKEYIKLKDDMNIFSDLIEERENPKNKNEVIESELKRRIKGEAASFEQRLSGKLFDYEAVLDLFAVPRNDLVEILPWLKSHKSIVENAIDRLYESDENEGYELDLLLDIPNLRKLAEAISSEKIGRYHRVIGKFLTEKTEVGSFLRDISAVPTVVKRSYFHPITNTLALGIPAICYYTEEGSLEIREKELIQLYGHEGMGHALNSVMTKNSDLPEFFKLNSALVTATSESVAQFYERQLLEDLKESPDTLRKLDIEHKFEEIFRSIKDSELIEKYRVNLFKYTVMILADKSLGKYDERDTMNKKIKLINEVAIDPSYGVNQVYHYSNPMKFDQEGNLAWEMLSELRYAANPVKRSLNEFEKQEMAYGNSTRSVIDKTFLEGMWTPIGFEQNAKFVANNK